MPKPKALALVWLCKTPSGWRRFPVMRGNNTRIKTGFVKQRGIERHYPEGRFEIRSYDGRKTVYLPAGTVAVEAQVKLDREIALSYAKGVVGEAGLKLEDTSHSGAGADSLKSQSIAFEEDAKSRNAFEAAMVNRLTVDEFINVTGRRFADEITREDIFKFHGALRKRGCVERTVSNKHKCLRSFFIFIKLDHKSFMPPPPKYDATLPEIYSTKQIAAVLKNADNYMKIAIRLGLMCGLREQEIMHAEWQDIDWEEAVYRVRSKPRYQFKIKDSEERDVPIPKSFLLELRAWRTANPEGRLILLTSRGNLDKKLLRRLKTLARNSGLNCGTCDGCCGKHEECEEWYLHKFRATYATTLLRNGVDLSTVQKFMGHSDLASTMRYLRPASSAETQKTVNKINWDKAA